ncbi:MAG: thioesterase family protein [Dissulfurispiraceae bacterium]
MTGTANIPIGASARKSVDVTRDITVAHFRPHIPEVYGAPMMIYLMEEAAAQAIQDYLPEGWVSVGAMTNVKHLAATPGGLGVTARAKVLSVSDNLITFAVEAHDGIEKIGEGIQVRAAIEVNRFEKRVRLKAKRASKGSA